VVELDHNIGDTGLEVIVYRLPLLRHAFLEVIQRLG